jgi:hypothetical protein
MAIIERSVNFSIRAYGDKRHAALAGNAAPLNAGVIPRPITIIERC